MRKYVFKDSSFSSNLTEIIVENSLGEEVGSVYQEDRRGYTDKEGFTYRTAEGQMHYLGRKSSRFPKMGVEYGLAGETRTYYLKRKTAGSLLYFRIEGKIDKKPVVLEENWKEGLNLSMKGRKLASVYPGTTFFKVTYEVSKEVEENTPIFALIILMYFVHMRHQKQNHMLEEIFQ